jgi:hypothetical protein
MNILNPNEITFEQAENSFLRVKMKNGEIIEKIECTPLFPLSKPDSYISVSHRKEKGVDEIGILKSLKVLSAEQRVLVENEIQFRYFSPYITDIRKITSKYGVDQWEVVTDRGEATFFVQDTKENVMIQENGLIIITDIDKCRFQIRDYRQLPAKARFYLENTLL